MKQELERINTKLGKITEDQAFIRADLNYHIKRTDTLENFMKGTIKLLVGIFVSIFLTIVGIGLKKVYGAPITDASLRRYVKIIEKETNCGITITSAKRTKAHNKRVGGAPRSWHLVGGALDIVSECKTPLEIGRLTSLSFNTRIYKTHVHFDLDPQKKCGIKTDFGWKKCPFRL